MDEVQYRRPSAGRRPAPARKPAGRFDLVSIALHWLTLVLVTGQFAAAWLIERIPEHAGELLAYHRAMGLVTWALVVGRFAWRKTGARLPPFPASMPAWRRAAATANEYALYALLLVQPLTGLGDTLLRGRPFQLGVWRVPALVAADKPLAHVLHEAHELGALALLVLIGLHAAAGIHHALRRDGVFQRMTP